MYYQKKVINGLCQLDYIRQQNVQLKDQLSVLLQLEISSLQIQAAERFHQKFIENDQIVELLRYEINTLFIQPKRYQKVTKGDSVHKKFQMIHSDIQNIKKEFLQLKAHFCHFKSTIDTARHLGSSLR